MLRKQLFTIALCVGFSAAFSQEVCRPQTMDEMLQLIEQNNKDLKAGLRRRKPSNGRRGPRIICPTPK